MTLNFNVMTDLGHDAIGFVYSENKRNLIQIFPSWKIAKMDISTNFTQSKIYNCQSIYCERSELLRNGPRQQHIPNDITPE